MPTIKFLGFMNKRQKVEGAPISPDPKPETTADIWKEIISDKENVDLFKNWLDVASTDAEIALLTDLAEALQALENPTPEKQTEYIEKFYNKKIERKSENIPAGEEDLLQRYSKLSNLKKNNSNFIIEPFSNLDEKGDVKTAKDLRNEFLDSASRLVNALKAVQENLGNNEEALKAFRNGNNAVSRLLKTEATQLICMRKIDANIAEFESKNTSRKRHK